MVRIDEQAGRFQLRLHTELNGRTGERVLHGQTCEEVTQAAITVLVLVLDAEATPRTAEDPLPIIPAATRPHRQAAPKPAGAPPPVRAARAFLASGVGVGHGVLPGMALAFEARAGVRWRSWSIEALGQLWPERTASAAALSGAGAEFWMLGLGLIVCPELISRPIGWRWRLCGGAQADWMRGHGFGVDEPASASAFGWTLVAGTGLSVPIAHGLSIGWTLHWLVPATRPRFVLDNVGGVFQRPWLGGRTALGLELTF